MKTTLCNKTLGWISALVMAGSLGFGNPPDATSLSGIIHDHTAVTAGSWELQGEYSLKTKGNGKADFSAILTMERSDYWAMTSGSDPNARSPHTHHVTLVDGTVTPITGGFEVSGMAAITANGNAAPFGLYSPVVIDITGGDTVNLSNIKLTFQGAAAGHFGSAPLSGVVRLCSDGDCRRQAEDLREGRELTRVH